MTWTQSKVWVQSGEYKESQTRVTQHTSDNGRFTVQPTGAMRYRKDNGVRGR